MSPVRTTVWTQGPPVQQRDNADDVRSHQRLRLATLLIVAAYVTQQPRGGGAVVKESTGGLLMVWQVKAESCVLHESAGWAEQAKHPLQEAGVEDQRAAMCARRARGSPARTGRPCTRWQWTKQQAWPEAGAVEHLMRCTAQACERPRAWGRDRDGRFLVLKGLEAENQTGSCYYSWSFCSLSERGCSWVGESCSQMLSGSRKILLIPPLTRVPPPTWESGLSPRRVGVTLPWEFRKTLVSVSNVCCELRRRHFGRLDSVSTFEVRQGNICLFTEGIYLSAAHKHALLAWKGKWCCRGYQRAPLSECGGEVHEGLFERGFQGRCLFLFNDVLMSSSFSFFHSVEVYRLKPPL